jgi:rod shape-determining protein MreD
MWTCWAESALASREVIVQLCIFVAIPSAVLMAVLQSTVTARLDLFGVSPDLVLLLVVSWTLLRGIQEGVVVALAGGMVLDALSGAPFGLGAAALLVACVLAGLGGGAALHTSLSLGNGLLDTLALRLITVVLVTWVYYGFVAFFLRLSGEVMSAGLALGQIILPTAFLNVLCMLPIYGLVRLMVARSQTEEPMEWR